MREHIVRFGGLNFRGEPPDAPIAKEAPGAIAKEAPEAIAEESPGAIAASPEAIAEESPGAIAKESPGAAGGATAVTWKIDDSKEYVTATLPANITVQSEPGAMCWKDNAIKMKSEIAATSNVFVKAAVMVEKKFSGESMFVVKYKNESDKALRIAFTGPYMGNIIGIALTENQISCKRGAFLCADKGVKVGSSVKFSSIFGEGFLFQSITGKGMVFLHEGGIIIERSLGPDEKIDIDTGCIVAFTEEVKISAKRQSVKSALFGGEGLFLSTAKLKQGKSTGTVWIQTMPLEKFAKQVVKHIPKSKRGSES